jgi:GNAT superfamily N-acetyltransferase
MTPVAAAVLLREVEPDDLPVHFEQQRDSQSNQQAGVAARDRQAFDAHWARNLRDPSVILRTIEVDGQRVVGYWLGREYRGRGIATAALSQFLLQVRTRPLHAHVVKHNPASLRVLRKCGFAITGESQFHGLDGQPCDEFVLALYDYSR